MSDAIENSHGWVLDVDGCLMRTKRAGGAGGEAMPGAAELVAALYAAGHTVVVCTNASEKTPAEYAAHLRSQGIGIRDEDFVTAGSAAAEYIAHRHPGARVLALGAEGLAAPLRSLGVNLADPAQPELADVVVVGAANGYSTEQINAASLAVDAGAQLYTTQDHRHDRPAQGRTHHLRARHCVHDLRDAHVEVGHPPAHRILRVDRHPDRHRQPAEARADR